MNSTKARIYIVDDHKLFVQGVISLLSDETDLEITGYSLSALDFLAGVEKLDVDVYLMDINMPDITGIELTRKLKDIKPEARVLALTMYDDFEYVENMIKSGADGYILKTASLEELSLAIKTVARGIKFFGNEIQEIVFNKIGGKGSANNPTSTSDDQANLTKREMEIISLIAKEYTTQEIAEKLFISTRTVETHRKNILSKTRVKSIIGLLKFAEQRGILGGDYFK
jgi:DNA-binding NarL/FixJ family response regulator